MKKPEDIPEEIVAKFASALGHEYSDAALCQHTAQDVRNALAAVWDEVYAEGFTDGFSDKEESEIHAELLEKHGWSPHISFWFEEATEDEAVALMDTLLDAADAAKPEHVNIGAIGSIGPGHRHDSQQH